MTQRNIQHIGTIFREASIRLLEAGGDDADVVIEGVYSTGSAVRRWDWDLGPYNEELSIDAAHIRRDRLDAGVVPILLDHVPTVRNTVGIVFEDWIEGSKAYFRAKLERGTPDADAILNKVRQGIIKTVSVGYRVHKLLEVTTAGEKLPTLRAIEWEPWEISFTPVPADAGAKLRKEDGNASVYPCEITRSNPVSTGDTSMTTATQANQTPAPEVVPAPIETRAAVTPAADPSAAIQAAIEAERQRSGEIRNLCTRHAMDAAFTEKLIVEGRSVQEAGSAILQALAERSAATPTNTTTASVGHSYDDPAVIRSALVEAYAFKVSPGQRPDGKAREFIGRSFLEGFGELLQARGERVEISREKLAERALHTTSDFPVILGDAAHRVIAPDYEASAPTYKQIANQIQFTDFRPHYVLKTGEFPALEKLGEGGEIKSKSIDDAKQESAQLETKAVMIGVSRNLLINDSLGQVAGILAKYGRRIAAQENKAAWDFLKSNPKLLSDGTALFHANHKNLYPTAVASPDHDTLSAIRAMLRKHETDGIPHNFSLKTLYVDPDLETDAERLAASILAAVTGEVNVFSGKFGVIVEPNLSSHNSWYAATSVSEAPTLVYGYLNGAEGPQVDTREGWNRMGMELRIVSDWGIGLNGEKGIVRVNKA